MPVTGGAREMAVAPSGKEVAFVVRGDVFVTSVEGGVTKRITTTPEEERGVGFSPDGKALIYASERNGRWAIYEARRARDEEPYFYASTVVKETPLVANEQQNYQPLYSPDGKEIAYIEDRNTLKILNLEIEAGAHAAHRQGDLRRRRRPPLPVEPRQQVDPVRLLDPGHRAGRGRPRPRRRQGHVRQPHAERLQRRPGDSGSWAARRCCGSATATA